MSYLLLAALAAFLLYLGFRWFVTADPARLAFVASTLAITIVAVVAILMIATGRIGSLYLLGMLVAPAALAWFRRRKAAAGGFGDPATGRTGRKSEAEGEWLRMELDLDSERIDGMVRQGEFAGRRLSELAEGDLLRVRQECAADADSVRLLEAYLDRRLGPEWRDRAHQGRARSTGSAMSREEALEILGLSANASAEDIKAAHRRLMAQLHPDRGGSTYLAAKINQARDLLLGD